MSEAEPITLIQKGISAAKTGNKREAYPLLRRATELDPGNKLGWLWLAGVAPSPDESAACLLKVLSIDPEDRLAREGLARLAEQTSGRTGAAGDRSVRSADLRQCPFCRKSLPQDARACPACGSRLTFGDLEAFFAQSTCDRPLVEQAIARTQALEASGATLAGQKLLALAHLNLRDHQAAIRHLRTAAQLDGRDGVLGELLERLQRRSPAPAKAKEQGCRTRILIVDDSPTVRKLVTITLERQGHEVIFAEDGMAALARINETLPDLVLLDINMPRMDGFQLCKTIKGSPGTKHIPVVMLTGRDGLTDKVRARMVGCEEFLSKPFEPGELNRLVDRHSKRNASRERASGGRRSDGS